MLSNNMTTLLNKIERRLGTRPLNLPEGLKKDDWVTIIREETLSTFSRFFPQKITVELNSSVNKKGEYFYLDEKVIPTGLKIIGIRDIEWSSLGPNSYTGGSGLFDFWSNNYGLEDIAMAQMRADQVSLFDNGIYLEFVEPNKVRLSSVTNVDLSRSIPKFRLDVFVEHPDNLTTISATKMETFEALAQADVAGFLYNELKLYEDLETVFGSVQLKLDDIRQEYDKRIEIVNKLEDGYVSAANDNQPLIYTI